MNTPPTKQLVIIGAGPAGFTTAFLAADQSLSVTLIDQDPVLGGTCLHRGCIPSKTLLSLVQTINKAKKAKDCGIHFQDPEIDLDEIRSFKKGVITKLSAGLMQLCGQKKITFLQGSASFINSTTISVKKPDESKETLEFERCVIATGSLPAPLAVDFQPSLRIMSSNEALDLIEIPKTLLVIGGGYIGMEMASIYAGFGSQVTICEAMDNVLTGIDQDLVAVLLRTFKRKINDIKTSTIIKSMTANSAGVDVIFTNSKGEVRQTFDRVLVATGRKPNTAALGLGNTQIQLTEKGFIQTNAFGQTHDKAIYAIGDITEGPMLAHKASYQATLVVDSLFGTEQPKTKTAIPAVVFTDPEIAYCGLTEKEAQQKNIQTKVIKFPWAANGRSVSMNRVDGLTKLILDGQGQNLLGAGIVGPEAGELIAQAQLLLNANIPLERISTSMFAHPTLSETFKECLDLSLGRSFYSSKGGQAAR
ncbi:MAG TPA: dihydrolipoyl dehydrogenase [Candidatus Omnitrophota bacterium]|mgnify:CR=1 FL=1|nr:dihydrolipoyl dehydrogenase [Candidatus Omnitrophota bacterium]